MPTSDTLIRWLPWLALLTLVLGLGALMLRSRSMDGHGSGFSLFTRRQRRRWPAWLLLLLTALLVAYLASRSLEELPADPPDAPALVTEPVPGAERVALAPATLPAAPEVPPQVTTVAPDPDPTPEIRASVESWRKAWSDKDVTAYLGAYADDFVPPEGLSPDDWRAQRRERLATARRITLSIDRLEVEVGGDAATARFVQHYRSGALNEKVVKRLALRRTDGGWKITEEVVETSGKR